MVEITRQVSREVTSQVTLEKPWCPNGVWVLVDGEVVISLVGDTIKIWDSKHAQKKGFTKLARTSQTSIVDL
jgi:hypothetical protein